MFNHKKVAEAHVLPAGGEGSPSASRPASLGGPMHAANSRGDTTAHSIVDACLTMKGDLESEGDILVQGTVIGNIRCKLLIIEVDALVEGGVEAEEVVVRGNSKGTLKADRVRLEKTAVVDSEIHHRSFAAEEGARIKGTLQCRDEPAAKRPGNGDGKENARTKATGGAKEQALNEQSGVATADAA